MKHDIALSDIFTGEEEFQPNQLENLMEIALLKNKPKFVKLLLVEIFPKFEFSKIKKNLIKGLLSFS